MKAMIMAAGVGSRLMPLTMDVPKPMIPMANQPLMENTVILLRENGFDEIICNLHYHADQISEYFGDGSKFGVSMHYSREEELMGTAGGVKRCEGFLDETFVIVSGDALTDVNLRNLYQQHKSKGALATIALKEVEEVQHFGVVITDTDGRIERFQEKPRPEEALSNNANTGIYIFEPEIFKYIPSRQFYDFGKQVFLSLVKMKAPFYGVEIDQYWCDVGNLNTYRQAHADILEGKVYMQGLDGAFQKKEDRCVLMGTDVQLGKQVVLKGNVVIGDRCRIEDGVILEDAVLWNDSVLEKGSQIRRAVVGSYCRIGEKCNVSSASVIASACILPADTAVNSGSRVFRSSGGELQVEEG